MADIEKFVEQLKNLTRRVEYLERKQAHYGRPFGQSFKFTLDAKPKQP